MIKKIGIVLGLVTGVAFGQMVNARLSTSVYNWQRAFSDGSTAVHLRTYQSILLDASKNNISLHAYLQASNDFYQPVIQDPMLRVHNLYLSWKKLANLVDVNFGRQPVIGGVGYGTMDGIYLKSNLYKYFLVKAFGGSVVSPYNRFEFLHQLSDNHVFGGQLISTVIPDTRVSVGYFGQALLPESYMALRVDSTYSNPQLREIQRDGYQESLLMADANYYKEKWDIYGRYDYNLLFEKTSRAEFSTRYQVNEKIGLVINTFSREPRIPQNSIFSVFESGRTNEYEFGGNYNVDRNWRAHATAAYTTYGNENAKRANVGVGYKKYSITYLKQTGVAGEMDGGSLMAYETFLRNRVMANVMLSYASYSIGTTDTRHDTYSLALGGNYRLGTSLSFDGQLQWLKNKYYDNDVRVFLRGNYWFLKSLNWLK